MLLKFRQNILHVFPVEVPNYNEFVYCVAEMNVCLGFVLCPLEVACKQKLE